MLLSSLGLRIPSTVKSPSDFLIATISILNVYSGLSSETDTREAAQRRVTHES